MYSGQSIENSNKKLKTVNEKLKFLNAGYTGVFLTG